MIEFIGLSTFSFISIISFGKIINYNARFNYFISVILLTFISFICLINEINFLLIFLKFFLIILFFYLLIKKKIKIEKLDYIYLISFIFLLLFNFNDFFSKTDVLSGYGYQIKVIFLNSQLPHLDTKTNFDHYNIELLQSIYFNYFISGAFNFREDIIILSQNLFLLICFITIIKPNDLKNRKKIFNIIKLFAIFYFLISIFLQNGKNILAEDFYILFVFGITIFIIENFNKTNFKSFIFLLICFFLLGMGKKAAFFLLLFPIGIIVFNKRGYKIKFISIIFFVSILIFSLNFYYNLNSEVYKNSVNSNFYNFSTLEDFASKEIKSKKFDIKNFENINNKRLLFNYSSEFSKLKKYHDKVLIRYAAFKNDKNSFLENLNNVVIKNITNIEVYKASVLPPARYIINKLKLDYKFPRISIILYYWILFILFLYFYIFSSSKKNLKIEERFFKYLFLTIIIISTNIILVFEDLLKHAEIINFTDNYYSFKLNPTDRDSSRYLGWSIIFSILFSIYFAKRTIGIKFSKYVNLILIALILVLPARSYGYLIKIDKGKKERINLEKNYNIFRNKFKNSCNKNIPIVVFDDDIQKHSFVRFSYDFYDYEFIQFYVNNNDKKYFQILNNTKTLNSMGCLIVKDKLPIKLMIDEQFNNEYFKVTTNNHKTLDYTVYVINM